MAYFLCQIVSAIFYVFLFLRLFFFFKKISFLFAILSIASSMLIGVPKMPGTEQVLRFWIKFFHGIAKSFSLSVIKTEGS